MAVVKELLLDAWQQNALCLFGPERMWLVEAQQVGLSVVDNRTSVILVLVGPVVFVIPRLEVLAMVDDGVVCRFWVQRLLRLLAHLVEGEVVPFLWCCQRW